MLFICLLIFAKSLLRAGNLVPYFCLYFHCLEQCMDRANILYAFVDWIKECFHRLTQFMYNLQQVNYHFPLFLSLSRKYFRMCKSDRIIELFILCFNKYLLHVYYMSGTVLGAGNKMVKKLDRAAASWQFHYTSENSCCTSIYQSKVRFSY